MIDQVSYPILQEAVALAEEVESAVGECSRAASDRKEQIVESDTRVGEGLMHQANILRIVVASPSDVQAEREALPGVVDELNHSTASERGLQLTITRWEDDAYAAFHPQGPQGLIDAILCIEDCDIFIGIFWRRFGTLVHDAKSGTAHEFQRAYEAW